MILPWLIEFRESERSRWSLFRALGAVSVILCALWSSMEGHAQDSQKSAFELSLTLSLEGAVLTSGDRAWNRSEERVVLDLPVSLNLDTLTGLPLGLIAAQGQLIREDRDLAKGSPLVDDSHAYSNLRAEDRTQLFEIYWEKGWGGLTTRLGKLDANDHFAVCEHETLLINGAAGYSPSIWGLPSYPDSAWSVQLDYKHPRFHALAAVFDGGSTTVNPTPTGQRFWLSDQALDGGLLWITQVTGRFGTLEQSGEEKEMSAPYSLSLGAWSHRGEAYRAPELAEDDEGEGSWGIYLTGDLKLLSTSRGGEVGLGLQAAISPHLHPLHLATAITWTQVSPPLLSAEDGLWLALGFSHLSLADRWEHLGTPRADSERLLELTAALPITELFTFSVSWISIWGGVLEEREAHLLVGRVVLTTPSLDDEEMIIERDLE